MRIAIGCDHAGFALKAPLTTALEADAHDVLDLGTFSTDPVDYPDFAKSVGQAVLRGFVDVGILVCGSGVGASIAANKLRGIRAALCHDLFTARQSREDDDANVLCLGARVLDEGTAIEVARAWLGARFTAEERHARRVAKIAQLEMGSDALPAAARPAAVSADVTARLTEIRALVRDRSRLATTMSYGPRYLHSTGQLHKGGPASGLFIQITGDDRRGPRRPRRGLRLLDAQGRPGARRHPGPAGARAASSGCTSPASRSARSTSSSSSSGRRPSDS